MRLGNLLAHQLESNLLCGPRLHEVISRKRHLESSQRSPYHSCRISRCHVHGKISQAGRVFFSRSAMFAFGFSPYVVCMGRLPMRAVHPGNLLARQLESNLLRGPRLHEVISRKRHLESSQRSPYDSCRISRCHVHGKISHGGRVFVSRSAMFAFGFSPYVVCMGRLPMSAIGALGSSHAGRMCMGRLRMEAE